LWRYIERLGGERWAANSDGENSKNFLDGVKKVDGVILESWKHLKMGGRGITAYEG